LDERQQNLYKSRIEVFISRLQGMFYEDRQELDVTVQKAGKGISFADRLKGNSTAVNKEEVWGENWDRAWFHIQGKVPAGWKNKNVVALINLGGESLVLNTNGLPLCGLSIHTLWTGYEFWRDRIEITEKANGNEKVEFWAEGSAGQLFGVSLNQDQGDQLPQKFGNHKAVFQYAELAIFRKDIWDLYLDFLVLSSLMKALPKENVRSKRILYCLNQAIDIFNSGKKQTATARSIVQKEMEKKSSASELKTTAVGHAHLDTAWLWPLHETVRKCARTFSSQIQLIEKYPNYVFGASQPQHYVYIKEYYPELYRKVKKKVAQGRIEIQGGMWVEADCNLISGESMVRQILYGKNFFKNEFDIEVRNLWLPDVFGYSAALPQILQKSGINYFVTQKISWNQFNRFPHHTFIWRGIDGSEVLTHFPPEDNYNSDLKPEAVINARNNFEESAFIDEFLTLFGIGDGGSGPTEEMIESGLRQANLEGTPRVQFDHAQRMLDRLEDHRDKLPIWVGELYLELHRGTLTTQAYNKKMNRFLELKLREIEILYSLCPLQKYPSEKLDTIWKKVLLHQFHDIIPGSSIPPVYEDSRLVYEELFEETNDLVQQTGALLIKENAQKLTLFNTLSFSYKRPVTLPGEWNGYKISRDDGAELLSQNENGQTVILTELPPLSAVTLQKSAGSKREQAAVLRDNSILENSLIRYEFDQKGALMRIFDKEESKEILRPEGRGNLFALYEDRPVNWDAWDIDIYYENQLLEHPTFVNRKGLPCGPVRQGIEQELKIGNSLISQKIYLSSNSKRIDFDTSVNWYEDHKMLRVSFEVDIRSDTATYEIQYGHVRRNTHRNTSWDLAKFEVVGHRFADLSDRDYGVALLNDCKYGYKIHDNVIDLNLLRAPSNPDPTADRGEHGFAYCLFPHRDEMIAADVYSEAAQLNQPPAIFSGGSDFPVNFPVKLDSEDIILEVLKKAENDDSLIVRLYEPYGKSTRTKLYILNEVLEINETDLLENPIKRLKLSNKSVDLQFNAFEIKTLKIVKI